MLTTLKGKTAFVTGGADSLGRECAINLAKSGANIVVADLNVEKAQEVAEELQKTHGVKAWAQKIDLWNWESCRDSCKEAIEKAGKIDILVASGATTPKYAKFAHEYDPAEDFEGIYRTQMWSRLYPVYGLLDHMRENNYGKIVIITSDSGRTPTPKEAYIGACAAGLIVADKVFAKEWARWGIRVNTICLTIINNSAAMRATMADPERAKLFQKTFDRAKFGVPEPIDVAEAALYFASPESDKITGSVFSVNGGLSFPG